METISIALVNQKGGVGKTTLSMNLAAAAHLQGFASTIVDCDAQASSFDWYAQRAEGSQLEGLTVVRVESPLTRRKFKELTRGRDFVFIDAPAGLGDMTRSVAMAADYILVPIAPGYIDSRSTGKLMRSLDEVDQMREMAGLTFVERRFVLNRAKRRQLLTAKALSAIRASSVQSMDSVVYESAVIAQASASESALTFGPDSGAASDIRALFEEVVARSSCRHAVMPSVIASAAQDGPRGVLNG